MGRSININTTNPYRHAERSIRVADWHVISLAPGVPNGRTTLTAVESGRVAFGNSQQALAELVQVSHTLGQNISNSNTTIIETDARIMEKSI